jgi:pyrroline-5-carboxylate reductase
MISSGFIGGGRVTKILLNGLKKAGIELNNVLVYDTSSDALKELNKEFPEIKTVSNNVNMLAASQDMIYLAVHPPAVVSVLKEIKSDLNQDAIVISLAPKPKMEQISSLLGGFTRIVRMIPNAPSIINEGYNPISFAPEISDSEKKEILDLFNVLGVTPEVDEDKLEAYAVLTAMGPTYFWFQFNELSKLGSSFGLEDKEIQDSLPKMIMGAAQTFYQSKLSPEEVMDLIPVKPMGEEEEKIKKSYQARLEAIFQQLKG